jgi:Ca2+-binding EF-hand superfamily protein
MLMMGEDMSEAEVEELIKSIDRNSNSRIDIEEFIGFLKEKEFT